MSPSASHLMPSTEIITTNTLIVTNLDPLVFLKGNFMKIKAKFEQYGSIYKLIPIKSFNRMLVIYFQTLDAKIAKIHSDKMIFMNNIIRVYYGLHTPVYDDETDKSKHHLNIPVLEKNRLDSPPGSPKTLVDDLGYKLVNINLNNSNSNGGNVDTHNEDFSLDNNNGGFNMTSLQFTSPPPPPPPPSPPPMTKIPILTIIPNDLGADNSHKDDVPMIFVQDWDDSLSSPSLLSSITSTSRPPIIY